MAFSLHYFQNDYQAINGTGQNHAATIGGQLTANSNDLYNGNIKVMQTTLTDPTTRAAMPMANAYQYDQLNRLLEARSFESGYANNAWNPTTYNNEYFNKFEYDAMGNILTQERRDRAGTVLEDLSYHYDYADPGTDTKLLRNRLFTVNDAAGQVGPIGTDLGDQSPFLSDFADIDINNNYTYDEEGRLKKDVSENIEDIVWRVDGKVKEIVRVSGSSTKNVIFDYDAMGNRIAKHVYDNSTGQFEKSTYYILDAQGNTMGTYDHEIVASDAIYNLKERHIYGSSRLGMTTEEVRLEGPAVLNTGLGKPLGLRYYECSNHLGNVLTVINDEIVPVDTDGDLIVDGYQVGIVNISDYSPFGVQLDGRTISNGNYRYGFNGMEKDDEVSGEGNAYSTLFRRYDPRIGRWWSIDPLMSKFPDMSPYVTFDNNPIFYTDPFGLSSGPGDGVGGPPEDTHTIGKGDSFWKLEEKWGMEHGTLQKLNPTLTPTDLQEGQVIFTKNPIQALVDNIGDKFEEIVGDINDGYNEFIKDIAEKVVAADAPKPNLEIDLVGASSGLSVGGWQYIQLKIGKGWWEANRNFSFHDIGMATGTGGLSVEVLSIGGGTLTIDENYWSKNKTWSLTELFKGAKISFAGGGVGYKGTKITISTMQGDLIAKGWLHSFSLSIGGGGSAGIMPDIEIPMNKEDSLKQAEKVDAGEFLRYILENK